MILLRVLYLSVFVYLAEYSPVVCLCYRRLKLLLCGCLLLAVTIRSPYKAKSKLEKKASSVDSGLDKGSGMMLSDYQV